jgi:ABC-2 type transport system ATP-binding protein
MTSCVKVENLRKEYRDFTLDNVSFEVPQGAIMGLVGENGAGKSTVIRLILGSIRRDGGSVSLFGEPWVDQVPNRLKDDIGVVFDECAFPETFNAAQLSAVFAGMFRAWDKEHFSKLLQDFNLSPTKKVKELSRGNRMKLSIAVALSHKPKLLILDEPTSGLDPVVRKEMLSLFQSFMEDETHSIILSSHITTDLERIADYITFIHQGKILLSEAKDELLDRHALFKGRHDDFEGIDRSDFVSIHSNRYGMEALSANRIMCAAKYPELVCDKATIDDILYHMTGTERTVQGEQA